MDVAALGYHHQSGGTLSSRFTGWNTSAARCRARAPAGGRVRQKVRGHGKTSFLWGTHRGGRLLYSDATLFARGFGSGKTPSFMVQ